MLSPLLSIDSLQNLFHLSKPSLSVMSTVTFLRLCLQNGMTPPPPASCSRVSRCWCRGPLLWHVAPVLCWRLSPLWLVVFLFSPLAPSPWQTHGAVELNLVAHISEATVFVLTLWFLFLLKSMQVQGSLSFNSLHEVSHIWQLSPPDPIINNIQSSYFTSFIKGKLKGTADFVTQLLERKYRLLGRQKLVYIS